MERDREEVLLSLAASQARSFDENAWVDVAEDGSATPDEVAATALFLAGGYWYGHEDALFRVAEKLAPGSRGHFARQARLVAFNCSRFDHMLQARLRHESRNA
jgi:hypothetical protein